MMTKSKDRPGAVLRTLKAGVTVAAVLVGIRAVPVAAQSASPAKAHESEQADVEALRSEVAALRGLVQQLKQEVAELRAQKAKGGGEDVHTLPLSQRIDALSAQMETAQARLDEVENIVIETDEKVGSRAIAHAFNADKLDIGGFLHTAVTLVDGRDNTEVAVNRLTFELLGRAQLSENWSVFVAQAFIRESGITYTDPFGRFDPNFNVVTKTPLVIATASYRQSDLLTIDLGRFITPHGIVNIEHFPAILLDTEQPQFLRPFGGQTIFANFMNGVRISGQTFTGFGGKGTLGYAAYVGSFVNNADSFNYGGRAFYTFGESGVTLGLNLGGGRRAGQGSQYWLVGGDLLIDHGPVLWKSEIFATDEDLGGNRLAFYTQPAWRVSDQWTAFYRFDFLDDGTGMGDRIEHALGLTFKPDPDIHLRLIFHRDRFKAAPGFPKANAESYQFAATFSF